MSAFNLGNSAYIGLQLLIWFNLSPLLKVYDIMNWIYGVYPKISTALYFNPVLPLLNFAKKFPQIYVPTNPKGAERLPPGIVVSETDLYLRRLWGEPSEVGHCFYFFSVHWSSQNFFFIKSSFCEQHLKYMTYTIRILLANQDTLSHLQLDTPRRQILTQR